ncbi:hypothetical protein D3C71_1996380 [compost metagenome]
MLFQTEAYRRRIFMLTEERRLRIQWTEVICYGLKIQTGTDRSWQRHREHIILKRIIAFMHRDQYRTVIRFLTWFVNTDRKIMHKAVC